jgi:hypothetical protein
MDGYTVSLGPLNGNTYPCTINVTGACHVVFQSAGNVSLTNGLKMTNSKESGGNFTFIAKTDDLVMEKGSTVEAAGVTLRAQKGDVTVGGIVDVSGASDTEPEHPSGNDTDGWGGSYGGSGGQNCNNGGQGLFSNVDKAQGSADVFQSFNENHPTRGTKGYSHGNSDGGRGGGWCSSRVWVPSLSMARFWLPVHTLATRAAPVPEVPLASSLLL